MNTLKILGIVVVVGLVVAVGAFSYITRPASAPSESVQVGTELPETDNEVSSSALFRISQDESQVEFNINEVLRGEDKKVIGTTSEVGGDIRVNLDDYSKSEIGKIRINARTLETDSDKRNGAISRVILRSEEFEFIEFQPTSISGLPAGSNSEAPINFKVTGDLTIVETTRPITFNVSVTSMVDDKLIGEGVATINYKDFDLTIPEVTFVASVEDEVLLKINFVANKVN